MKCAVYSSKSGDSLLLVDDNLWVINGLWQIIKENNIFYCLSPRGTYPIDIHLVGYIEYDGCYNSALSRFRNGEGEHLSIKETPVIESVEIQVQIPESVRAPELCKKKYYGIECFCSKCKR